MDIPGGVIIQDVTRSSSRGQLAELPFDILLRIALSLPLKDAVLLCALSRRVHEELTSNRTFWSSLLFRHRSSRPFKFPMFDDTMALDLEALKDIIISSLKLETNKHDYPPSLRSSIPLGDTSDHRILFTVPGTAFVVTTSLSANAAYCWDDEKQTLACSISFKSDKHDDHDVGDVLGGTQRELRDYSSVYEDKDKALFGLYSWLSRTVHLLELDYADRSAPKLSIAFSTSTGPSDDSSPFVVVCVRPRFMIIVTSGEQTRFRLVDVASGRASSYILQIAQEGPIFNISPSLLDDHLHLFVDHSGDGMLYISEVSITDLLLKIATSEEKAFDEDHGSRLHSNLPVRSLKMPFRAPQVLNPSDNDQRRYGLRLFAAPHSPQCVLLEVLLVGTETRALISHWDLRRQHSTDPVDGSRLTIELPLEHLFRWYDSRWCRTMLAEARSGDRTESVMVVRFFDNGTYVTPLLVLPEGGPGMAEITDMAYDDSRGVLVLLTEGQNGGQFMHSFGYID